LKFDHAPVVPESDIFLLALLDCNFDVFNAFLVPLICWCSFDVFGQFGLARLVKVSKRSVNLKDWKNNWAFFKYLGVFKNNRFQI
jgi:hypothetical protein